MGITGIAGGLFKIVRGIVEEDGELIAKGAFKTLKSTVTTVVSIVTDPAEIIHKSEDHDDD